MPYRKKLIEVALPLEAINRESAREKSIRHGHPSTLHLWWARRPLAACRAVLFAQMVDDPSSHPERFPTEEAQETERQRLFRLIEELVKWENINNEELLEQARAEIRKSAGPDGPPPLLDPFAGGGSIPLEAQRLGLEAHAGDLNPVAVLINKALIEIPPRFANRAPVNPEAREKIGGQTGWKGAAGLADDVRYYGKWMRDEATKRIGHLYPKIRVTAGLLEQRADLKAQGLRPGSELTVIAWLWARTVQCPNPACGALMPLVRSFWLSKKKNRQAWVEPIVSRIQNPPAVHFEIRTGRGKPRDGTTDRRGATCLCCGTPVPLDHVRTEGKAKRMNARLMAIVAQGQGGRIYLAPHERHECIAASAEPEWLPEGELQGKCRVSVPLYGMNTFADLFTPRQLVVLTTFSDVMTESWEEVWADARSAGFPDDSTALNDGGAGAMAYADAVVTYLAFAIDKGANYWSTLCAWHASRDIIMSTFARQALPMVWDFAEANPFSNSSGNFLLGVEQAAKMVSNTPARGSAVSRQLDATSLDVGLSQLLVCTDPPYYDNIGYADLSDFFYVWLRHSMLSAVYPDLFGTLLVPKAQELVATPYRFGGGKQEARQFFEDGLQQAFQRMHKIATPDYPLTVFYAFKQAETRGSDTASTGWETMLEGLIQAGFAITGTWPMRTELVTSLKKNVSALASSVVLVCRSRADSASLATRRDFLNALSRELPAALKDLQRGNIAPVDLAQASIGPGMAIFSRYQRVLEADGSSMRIRTALALINQALDEYLSEQESEYDADTRWALAWFEQFGFNEGSFGDAETLCKAKNTSVGGMVEAGILEARAGKVRLLRREELGEDWTPGADRRLTVWEVTQHLIRAVQDRGEGAAAELVSQVGGLGETARDLAYRLYTLCERKGWAQEALPYNGLVVAWREIVRLAEERRRSTPVQAELELG